jgi:Fe-S-cluster containining protein
MKLETNIKRIEQLIKEKEDANWEFRCFIKASDISIEDIDSVVHEVCDTISRQIDCRQCANCCKVVRPLLQQKDVNRLARALNMSEYDFIQEYLVEGDEDADRGYFFRRQPCPFLNKNLCTVYPSRPHDCRSYPHLYKKEFIFRVNQAYFNCSVCPIVYNVYEGLKQRLWDRRQRMST